MMLTDTQLSSLLSLEDVLPPISIDDINITCGDGWVYMRYIGCIPVRFGSHEWVMAEIELRLQGYKDYDDFFMNSPHASNMFAEEYLAESFIEREGTAYRSSSFYGVIVGEMKNLNPIERRGFNKWFTIREVL